MSLGIIEFVTILKHNVLILNILSCQVDYYAHPEHYKPIFHEKIAPYASVIGMQSSFLLIYSEANYMLQLLPLLVKTQLWIFGCYYFVNQLKMYSLIVNCMYWEKRFPRLLSTKQLQDLIGTRCPLVGISDITCDIGGSIEFVNQTTSIDSPFFRYFLFQVNFLFIHFYVVLYLVDIVHHLVNL